MGQVALLAVVLAACTTTGDEALKSPTHTITWSSPGANDDHLGPVDCGTMISHPCPWLLFTTLATLYVGDSGDVNVTWWGATGGTDANGFPADHHLPELEIMTEAADGSLTFADRGDDAGLRHAGALAADGAGYSGDVTWSLFAVAGHTTWHLTID